MSQSKEHDDYLREADDEEVLASDAQSHYTVTTTATEKEKTVKNRNKVQAEKGILEAKKKRVELQKRKEEEELINKGLHRPANRMTLKLGSKPTQVKEHQEKPIKHANLLKPMKYEERSASKQSVSPRIWMHSKEEQD